MNFIKKRYPQADFSEIGEINYSNKENEKGIIVAFWTIQIWSCPKSWRPFWFYYLLI